MGSTTSELKLLSVIVSLEEYETVDGSAVNVHAVDNGFVDEEVVVDSFVDKEEVVIVLFGVTDTPVFIRQEEGPCADDFAVNRVTFDDGSVDRQIFFSTGSLKSVTQTDEEGLFL
ncbi:hypothetical protein NDU88_011536 [Pleurodeles waltl]|uniref:Uncharacterized protein n=1 Tax=Pleurodeles waltl TaxID=8319 RepID=A0AAV7QZ16_PLEWA|nr:hypothetical protein NDU88_011536 [Pleurodeles waltl]